MKSLSRGAISLFGRDRQTFLQGQVTNDIARLMPGQGAHACLLNNTGHLLADLRIYAFADHLLIETDPERAGVVAETLDRYLVREKVMIEDSSRQWTILTAQGQGALATVVQVVMSQTPLAFGAPFSHMSGHAVLGDVEAFVVLRSHTSGAPGYDLWLPSDLAPEALDILKALPGATELDDETYDLLRIEAGTPKWGAELDESVIPLEAGMEDAISYTKGCYMGQEIIARIHSRGHTNRSLRGLKLSRPASAGDALLAQDGPRGGQEVGRITSSAVSPDLGPIALGYVRNEYISSGVSLTVGNATATVTDLPFVSGTG